MEEKEELLTLDELNAQLQSTVEEGEEEFFTLEELNAQLGSEEEPVKKKDVTTSVSEEKNGVEEVSTASISEAERQQKLQTILGELPPYEIPEKEEDDLKAKKAAEAKAKAEAAETAEEYEEFRSRSELTAEDEREIEEELTEELEDPDWWRTITEGVGKYYNLLKAGHSILSRIGPDPLNTFAGSVLKATPQYQTEKEEALEKVAKLGIDISNLTDEEKLQIAKDLSRQEKIKEKKEYKLEEHLDDLWEAKSPFFMLEGTVSIAEMKSAQKAGEEIERLKKYNKERAKELPKKIRREEVKMATMDHNLNEAWVAFSKDDEALKVMPASEEKNAAIDVRNANLRELQKQAHEVQRLANTINDDIQDLQSLAVESDLLKRNYDATVNIVGRLGASTASLGIGIWKTAKDITDMGLMVADYTIDGVSAGTGMELQGFKDFVENQQKESLKEEEYIDAANEYINTTIRGNLRKARSLDDLESFTDWAQWTGDLFADQLPQLAMITASGGNAGLYLLAASAYGNKLNDMEKEMAAGLADYDFWQLRGTAAMVGVGEFLSEKVTQGIIKRAMGSPRMYGTLGKIDKGKLSADFKRAVAKNYKDKFARLGIWVADPALEGGSEVLAQINENIADRYILGKDVSLWDHVPDAFVSGVFIGTGIKVAGGTMGLVMKPYVADKNKTISKNLEEIKKLTEMNATLQQGEQTAETKAIINQINTAIAQLEIENGQMILGGLDVLNRLSADEIREVSRLDDDVSKIRDRYRVVSESTTLEEGAKADLIKSIEKEYNRIVTRKDALMNIGQSKDARYMIDGKEVTKDELSAFIKDENNLAQLAAGERSIKIYNDRALEEEFISTFPSPKEVAFEELTEEGKKERVATLETAVGKAKESLGALLEEDTDIRVLESQEAFDAAVKEADMKVVENEGALVIFDKETGKFSHILVNAAIANEKSVIHEAMHVVLQKTLAGDPALFNTFKEEITTSLKEAGETKLVERIEKFAAKYKEGDQSEEFLAELGAAFTDAGFDVAKLTPEQKTILERIKAWILKNIPGLQALEETTTPEDVLTFMTQVSTSLQAGRDVTAIVAKKKAEVAATEKVGHKIQYGQDEKGYYKLVDGKREQLTKRTYQLETDRLTEQGANTELSESGLTEEIYTKMGTGGTKTLLGTIKDLAPAVTEVKKKKPTAKEKQVPYKLKVEGKTKVFNRVDPIKGEPLAIELGDGWPLVRLESGEYTDGDQVYDNFDQLLEQGKKYGFIDESYMPSEMSPEREAEIRNRDTVKEFEEKGTFGALTELAFWNRASDFLAKKLGYDSPMEAQEAGGVDIEIWSNLQKKAMRLWEEGKIKGPKDLEQILVKEEKAKPTPKKKKPTAKEKKAARVKEQAKKRAEKKEVKEEVVTPTKEGAPKKMKRVTREERKTWQKAKGKEVTAERAPTKKAHEAKFKKLVANARKLYNKEITVDEYLANVKEIDPQKQATKVPKPATFREVDLSIEEAQAEEGLVGQDKTIKSGTKVVSRVDIKSRNRYDMGVVPLKDKPSGKGWFGYSPTAVLKNATWDLSPANVKTALEIGMREKIAGVSKGKVAEKTPMGWLEGTWENMTPEQAYEYAQKVIGTEGWTQISMNPARHSYTHEVGTEKPVIAAEEVIQIGNFLLAKNVTFASPKDVRYAAPSVTGKREIRFQRKSQISERRSEIKGKKMGKELFGFLKRTPESKDDYKGLKREIKLQSKAALNAARQAKKETKLWYNVAKKIEKRLRTDLQATLKEISKGKKGKLSPWQVNAIINKYRNTNIFDPKSVDTFVDYMYKVINDADFKVALNKVNKLRKQTEKNVSKAKFGANVSLVADIKRLLGISPQLVPTKMWNRYADLLEQIGAKRKQLSLEETSIVEKEIEAIREAVYEQEALIPDLSTRFYQFIAYNPEEVVTKKGESIGYKKIIDKMKEAHLLTDEEVELMNNAEIKKQIISREGIEPKTEEQREEEHDEALVDALAAVEDINDTIKSESDFFQRLPEGRQRDIARTIIKLIKNEALFENFSTSSLKDIAQTLRSLSNGYVTNVTQDIVEALHAQERAIALDEVTGKTKLRPFEKYVGKLKALMRRSKDKDTMWTEAIRRNPLVYIDQTLGVGMGDAIYRNMFEPIARAYDGYRHTAGKLRVRLAKAQQKLSTALGEDTDKIVKAKYKIQAALIQREYEANPGNPEVNTAVDFLDATIENSDQIGAESIYRKKDIEVLTEIRNTLKNKGLEGLLAEMTPQEKAAMEEIRSVYDSMGQTYVETSTLIRGMEATPRREYVHISVLPKSATRSKFKSVTEAKAEQYGKIVGGSTKSKVFHQRTGNVNPIKFDPFTSASKSVKETLMDAHLTEALRTVDKTGKALKALVQEQKDANPSKEMKQKQQVVEAIIRAVESVRDNIIETEMIELTPVEQILEELAKAGYVAMLASPDRAIAEYASNVTAAMIAFKPQFTEGDRYSNIYKDQEKGSAVMSNLKSAQIEKSFPARQLSGSMVEQVLETDDLGPSTMDASVGDYITTMYNKLGFNVKGKRYGVKQLREWSMKVGDKLISTPDQIVTRRIWFGSFAMEFKKRTGKDVDFEKIAQKDDAYMSENAEALDEATRTADKDATDIGAAKNPAMGLIKAMVSPRDGWPARFWKRFDNFMTNFMMYEYAMFRKGVDGLVRRNDITQKQGALLMLAAFSRMTMYSFLTGTLYKLPDLLFKEEDDEEEEIDLLHEAEKAVANAFLNLTINKNFGNAVRSANSWLFEEVINRPLTQARGKEYDSFRDAYLWGAFPVKSDVVKPWEDLELTELVAYKMLGPLIPSVKSVGRTFKVARRDPKTEEAKARRLMELLTRTPLELAGNLGYIPAYKLWRRYLLAYLYSGYQKDKKKKETGPVKAEKKTQEKRQRKTRTRKTRGRD